MKNITRLKTELLQITLVMATVLSISSCNDNQKLENSQFLAEKANEDKFDTTAKAKDAEFLVQAAEINLEEIQLGQLAQQKSKCADIKELGKMMEVQHSQCFIDLTALAHKESITIPTAPNNNVEDAYKMLSNKSGADFDTTYCNMMVKGHKRAIAMFEKESVESNNTNIKQWAAETLPNLGIHLDHALACQKKCKK